MTVPDAVSIAKKYLVDVLPDFTQASINLEELETPPNGQTWRFTFSAVMPLPSGALSLQDALRSRRISKSVEIDRETGDLLAVKNAAA
jgi:hypothetical protein